MPIQITISGDTAVEALRELHGLSAGLVVPDTRPVAEEVPAKIEPFLILSGKRYITRHGQTTGPMQRRGEGHHNVPWTDGNLVWYADGRHEFPGPHAFDLVGPAPAVAEEVPAEEEKVFPEAPKRRGRPPKAESAPVEQPTPMADKIAEEGRLEDADADERQAEEANKPFTVDDARKALSDLLAQPDGKTKAQAVFAEMKCTKLSEIPEGEFKAFIAAIAKARGL